MRKSGLDQSNFVTTIAETTNPSTAAANERRHRILNGDLRQQVLLLALPTLFQQFLTFCVGMFDTWLSGQIDATATTAIGASAYIGWLAGLLVTTVSIGTMAMVSRHCGAREPAAANRVMNVSLLVGQTLSIVLSGMLFLAAPFVVSCFQLHGRTAEVALSYLRLDAIGHLLTGITIVGAAALRGAGDMKRPMVVLGTINVLNMIISVCLVYGVGPDDGIIFPMRIAPSLGVYGIAIGTVASRLIGGLLMLGVLMIGSDPLRFSVRLLKPDFDIIRRLFLMGRFATLDSSIHWCGQFAFLMIIKRAVMPGVHDDAVFAAHVIGVQVEAITYLPAMAWGQCAAAIIGQSLGAGKLKRAFKAGFEAAKQCGLLGLVMTVVFFFGASAIYNIMHNDTDVISVGVPAFRWMAWFQVPLVVFLVFRSCLQGAGDTRWPMFGTVMGICLFRLPGAWFFGVHLQWGLTGAWLGMFADIVFRSVLMSWRYSQARWVRTKV